MRMIRSLATATCVVTFLAGIVLADAQSDYEMLFGEEAKKVSGTKDTRDDADFAAKVLKGAKSMADDAKLQVLLYEKACDFAMADPKGYATAREAIKLLEQLVPDRQAEWRSRKLKILEFSYTRSRGSAKKEAGGAYLEALLTLADQAAAAGKPKEAYELYRRAYGVAGYLRSPRVAEIAARIKQINLRAIAAAKRESQFKKLAAALAGNPGDPPARTELILFCLVELDDPAKAASLLATSVDEKLREYIPLAAKNPPDLSEATCMELGQWYHKTLLAKASPAGKPVVLARARMYYERYLSLHTKRDVGRYKASAALAEVNKELKKLGVRPSPKVALAKALTLDLGKDVMMKLVRIPAGSFLMGSPKSEEGRRANEGPQHKVTISKPFHMGITEVTQEQYAAVMGENPSRIKGPKNPVEKVTWNAAVEFCKKLSAKTHRTVRLPTEAEWEYACRAGSKTRFCFGDDDKQLGDYAWYEDNNKRDPHPVGQKKANAFGLHDMHGNVWEWCSDWYAKSYAGAKTTDPQGVGSGKDRVHRGGSWFHPPKILRAAIRSPGSPGTGYYYTGFRVVVVPPAAKR